MGKTAFIFPGQGAQYVGMASDFIADDPILEAVLEEFDRNNNTSLHDIMKNGPEEALTETRFTQPAILFHSMAALRTFQKHVEVKPDFVAGHSLGEFTALAANGVLNIQDAMYLVHKRGEFMIKANKGKPYAMAAVIGLDPGKVKSICEKASTEGLVIAANFNTPVQTVISGSESGVESACRLAGEKGAKRIVKLAVGGPFHSPMIAKASKWLEQEMESVNFSYTGIPVVSNVSARAVTEVDQIKKNLALQVISPVLWLDSIRHLKSLGVEIFLEFGPKKVLAGMLRKIDRELKVISIEKIDDIEPALSSLENLI